MSLLPDCKYPLENRENQAAGEKDSEHSRLEPHWREIRGCNHKERDKKGDYSTNTSRPYFLDENNAPGYNAISRGVRLAVEQAD
jgi:hypothetical protein